MRVTLLRPLSPAMQPNHHKSVGVVLNWSLRVKQHMNPPRARYELWELFQLHHVHEVESYQAQSTGWLHWHGRTGSPSGHRRVSIICKLTQLLTLRFVRKQKVVHVRFVYWRGNSVFPRKDMIMMFTYRTSPSLGSRALRRNWLDSLIFMISQVNEILLTTAQYIVTCLW